MRFFATAAMQEGVKEWLEIARGSSCYANDRRTEADRETEKETGRYVSSQPRGRVHATSRFVVLADGNVSFLLGCPLRPSNVATPQSKKKPDVTAYKIIVTIHVRFGKRLLLRLLALVAVRLIRSALVSIIVVDRR